MHSEPCRPYGHRKPARLGPLGVFTWGLLLIGLLVAKSWAWLPPFDPRERYEEDLIAEELERMGLEVDSAPAGKVVEKIIYLPKDCFVHDVDPVPVFFNHFHATTRPHILAQEMLFKEGEPLSMAALEETARNLRTFFILAIARIAVAKGSRPGHVVVVVVTKDLWSLRPNSSFQFPNGKLELLSFLIAEHNLAGRNKFLGVRLRLDPATFLVGQQYTDPRVWGTRIQLDETASVIFNRDRGGVEGVLQSINIGQPLYSLRTKWAWSTGFGLSDQMVRLFRNGDIRQDPLPSGTVVAREYREQEFGWSATGTRSFGYHWKQNLTLSYGLSSRVYHANDPRTAAEFATTFLPFSERASAVSLGYRFYEARFVRLQDIDSYAISEDYRLGPDASATVEWANPIFGLSADFVRLAGRVGYSEMSARQNIFGVSASIEARRSLGGANPFPANWIHRIASAQVTNISPPWHGLRLHMRGLVSLRDFDLTRGSQLIGASSGLRGFPAGQFGGRNLMLVNVEVRTKAISVFTCYLGVAAFYDGGTTFPAPAGVGVAGYHQNVGVGLRLLLPQFNHQVLRADVAFPLAESTPGLPPVVFSFAFGQAF